MTTARDPALDRLARGVDCHRCGAWTDTPCTTGYRSGRPTAPHRRRIDRAVARYLADRRNRQASGN